MAARIEDQVMTAEYGGRVIATARYSSQAATDGQGGWIVSGSPPPPVQPHQAITAMVVAKRLAAGYTGDDLFVIGWREELRL